MSNLDQQEGLKGGAYELIRSRLNKHADDLRGRLTNLNTKRKDLFGNNDLSLISTERITTENKCVPRDMVSVGDQFIFAYNVHIGLRSTTELSDVFTVCSYNNNHFQQQDLSLIDNGQFKKDFSELFKYYKDTHFLQFVQFGPFLYMTFQVGNKATDIKAFKWKLDDGVLTYIDNRSEHEIKLPEQYDFTWKTTSREMFRHGEHSHISIEDKIFVETVGGDLTIKVEDNTTSGKGIFTEPVEHPEQKLEDAEVSYAIVGNLIILKVLPYREEEYRYIIYNEKIQHAVRVDGIEQSCVLLPNDNGVIFPSGVYLQSGETKMFNHGLEDMVFITKLISPNGEDFNYVFYNIHEGVYILLSYNLVERRVDSPLICNGYALFEDGQMCVFKTEEEAQNHHAIQIWSTPYYLTANPNEEIKNTFLGKLGNKEVVRALSECNEIVTLISKDDSYANLYIDIVKKTTDINDTFYWLNGDDAENIDLVLEEIKSTADSAISEFEKVVRLKKSAAEKLSKLEEKFDQIDKHIKFGVKEEIQDYVDTLGSIREVRGEIISAKETRYIDLNRIQEMESTLQDQNQSFSNKCVDFLLEEKALEPYRNQVKELSQGVSQLVKVYDAKAIEEHITKTSQQLEMLIDVVSNLSIEDVTHTTNIIDSISGIYSDFNVVGNSIKKKKKELQAVEGKAEFSAQMKLIAQSLVNYIDLSDTVAKCDEYLSKLMIQLEELEGKFIDFEEYILQISEKREELYDAFETKKIQISEANNRLISNLSSSAERIIKSIGNRLNGLKSIKEINGYMVSDLMVEKVRNIVDKLVGLGNTVKADDLSSRLKSTQEEAIRQLKDKKELFDDENTISFGNHKFFVNRQSFDLSIVPRDQKMYYHISGTNFFQEVEDVAFNERKQVWNQAVVSENTEVYRGEYLAWIIFEAIKNKEVSKSDLIKKTEAELADWIEEFMQPRYDEGYSKGIHNYDAAIILGKLLDFEEHAGVIKYPESERAFGLYFWNFETSERFRTDFLKKIKAVGVIQNVFPDNVEIEHLIEDLAKYLGEFYQEEGIDADPIISSEYLVDELAHNDQYSISKEAFEIGEKFNQFLHDQDRHKVFQDSLKSLDNSYAKLELSIAWIKAFVKSNLDEYYHKYVEETALFSLLKSNRIKLINLSLRADLSGLKGDHPVIKDGVIDFDFRSFENKMKYFESKVVSDFVSFQDLKKDLLHQHKKDLKLNEFRPKVMSSFVRNKLINDVYLPIIGDNLAKQIGAAGDQKRTDLMGMLLLISPPGYGKTTLMEYIASRLGIVFLKVNGPALGHQVVSLDPEDAPNAGAREEVEKLNLGFEMGDNVMIYLDDIQHCNPEFLQKFISLCDGQRKIEGVYNGESKTYDLRGKKVCVVMAGNPFTESGDKFQIPDMLSNRADVYNLGDILGDKVNAFELSYLENALTSNSTLQPLSNKSQQDFYNLVKMAEGVSMEGMDFESDYSPEELNEYKLVLKRMIEVRDIILEVNQEYIKSAAMDDQYRIEPAFKLQGSYRNMNRIAEKIHPIMNEKELKTLVLSYYENESQTLTTSAEGNLLKFKSLFNWLGEGEETRWEEIKTIFEKGQKMKGYGSNNQVAALMEQFEELTKGLMGIQKAIDNNKSE